MLSILNRYFSRELALNFLAVSAVLLAVIVSKSFGTLLTKVMDGKLPADVVLSMLGLGILDSSVLLAPFALLVTVLLVLGRFYRDSEIYAMGSGGMGFCRMLGHASLFVLPVIAVLSYASLYSVPEIAWQMEKVKLQAKERTSLLGLVPGRFVEARRGDWVVFVEDTDRESASARNIFIYDRRKEGAVVETARSVHQAGLAELGGESLVLNEGRRYEGFEGQGEFRVITFEQHAVRIPELGISANRLEPEFMSIMELVRSGRTEDHAELQWRLSIPLAAVLLVVLAFPLSVVKPRQGRFAKLGLAIVIYLIYSNLLILAEIWVADGKLPVFPGMLAVHALMAVLIAGFLLKQRMTE